MIGCMNKQTSQMKEATQRTTIRWFCRRYNAIEITITFYFDFLRPLRFGFFVDLIFFLSVRIHFSLFFYYFFFGILLVHAVLFWHGKEKIKIKCKHYKFYTYFTALFHFAWRCDTMIPREQYNSNFFTMMILIWKLADCYIFSFRHLSHIFHRILFVSPNLSMRFNAVS